MTEVLKNLNLEDDFLFTKTMQDADVCKRVLEVILDIEIEKVVFVQTENTVDIVYEGKGIRCVLQR